MRRILLSAAVAVVLFGVPAHPAVADPVEVLDQPIAVAVDGDGNVFAADKSNSFISKFASDGTFLTRFGGLGNGPGQLGTYLHLAVSDAGDVYVADNSNDRVAQFTNDGAFVRTWGTYGLENGQFRAVAGIDVDADGHVFVVDPANARVQKFTADGQFMRMWGRQGSFLTEFSFPVGIAVDASGSVYVADSYNRRVQKFSNDLMFQSVISRSEWGSEFTGLPRGLTVGPSGVLSVVTGTDKIEQFGPNGSFMRTWPVGLGDPHSQFYPGVDGSGNIYVPDSVAGSVIKFSEDGRWLDTFTSTGLKLNVATEELPRAQAGKAYAANLAARGGTAPYTWRVASGALPAGLSLTAQGLISGTTAKATQTRASFEVTDSHGDTVAREFAVYVEPLIATGSALPSATLAKSYSATLKATGGAGFGYKWALDGGSLPTGLKLSSSGAISGTPTAHGAFEFTVGVSDGGKPANTAEKHFSLSVSPMTITTASVPSGLVGKAYPSTTLKVTGGKATYRWSVSSGALPAGLKLSTAGALSGAPTVSGEFTFTAKVTDGSVPANVAERQFTIAVSPMTILTATLPQGTARKTYPSTTLKASGGKGALTWSIDSGALPPGLKLGAGGYLSGTPATAGTYSFVAKVADTSTPKNYATRPFAITIN